MKKNTMSYLPSFTIWNMQEPYLSEYKLMTFVDYIVKNNNLINSVQVSGSIKRLVCKISLVTCLGKQLSFHLSGNAGKKNSQLFYDNLKKEYEEVRPFFTLEEFVRLLTGLTQVDFLIFLMKNSLSGLVVFIRFEETIRPVCIDYNDHKKVLIVKFFSRKEWVTHILINNPQ